MKIVNLDVFRSLPNGTIFLKYEPCCFGSLSVKEETDDCDFIYSGLESPIDCNSSGDAIDMLVKAQEEGISVDLDFNQCMRDGCFDNDQLFAVYERKDIEGMIDKLTKCLESSGKNDIRQEINMKPCEHEFTELDSRQVGTSGPNPPTVYVLPKYCIKCGAKER